MVTTPVWHVEQNTQVVNLIGKVTIRWAALDVLLADLIYIDSQNYALAHDSVFGSRDAGIQRIQRVERAIGSSRFTQEERTAIFEITKKLSSIIGMRNEIIHSPLLPNFAIVGKRLQSDLVQVKRAGHQKFSISAVEKHLDGIATLLFDLERTVDQLSNKYLPPPID